MEKIILNIASSLDGYIARENGDIDWLPESGTSGYDEFYKTIETVVMGKTTYDQVLTFGAYPYREKKSYVFTRNSEKTNDENTEFVSDVDKFLKHIIPNLKGNIWLIGGGKLISSFVNLDMVDEIVISIIHIVLGKGIPLFKNIQKETKLELIKTINYDKLVELHYKILK